MHPQCHVTLARPTINSYTKIRMPYYHFKKKTLCMSLVLGHQFCRPKSCSKQRKYFDINFADIAAIDVDLLRVFATALPLSTLK